MNQKPNKHAICANCGHYYFLHDALNGECQACDEPTVQLKVKCPEFKEENKDVRT